CTAEKMMTAAWTAPKAKGIDNLVISIAEGETITLLSEKLKELFNEGKGTDYFVRDAENILSSNIIILIALKLSLLGLNTANTAVLKTVKKKASTRNVHAL
ncbi:MAG: hypothetical protein WBJ13_06380, partial [Sedimentibacter sp.]